MYLSKEIRDHKIEICRRADVAHKHNRMARTEFSKIVAERTMAAWKAECVGMTAVELLECLFMSQGMSEDETEKAIAKWLATLSKEEKEEVMKKID